MEVNGGLVAHPLFEGPLQNTHRTANRKLMNACLALQVQEWCDNFMVVGGCKGKGGV